MSATPQNWTELAPAICVLFISGCSVATFMVARFLFYTTLIKEIVIIIQEFRSCMATLRNIYTRSRTFVANLSVHFGQNSSGISVTKVVVQEVGNYYDVKRMLNKKYGGSSKGKLRVHLHQEDQLVLNVQRPLYVIRNNMLLTPRACREYEVQKNFVLPNCPGKKNWLRQVLTPLQMEILLRRHP